MAADSEKPIDHRQMKAFVDRIVKLDESDDMINARVFDWSERKNRSGENCATRSTSSSPTCNGSEMPEHHMTGGKLERAKSNGCTVNHE
jgi:hypothetical protein